MQLGNHLLQVAHHHAWGCVPIPIATCGHCHSSTRTHENRSIDPHGWMDEWMHACYECSFLRMHASIHPFIHPSVHTCIHTYSMLHTCTHTLIYGNYTDLRTGYTRFCRCCVSCCRSQVLEQFISCIGWVPQHGTQHGVTL